MDMSDSLRRVQDMMEVKEMMDQGAIKKEPKRYYLTNEEIVLPESWALEDTEVETEPARGFREDFQCEECMWNGYYSRFMVNTGWIKFPRFNVSETTDCPSCKVMRAILWKCLKEDPGLHSKALYIRFQDGVARIQRRLKITNIAASLEYETLSCRQVNILPCPTLNQTLKPCGTPSLTHELFDGSQSGVESSISWAKEQLSKCVESHNECAFFQKSEQIIPTRLININPDGLDGDVVLQDSSNLPHSDEPFPRYVALSYCWGTYEPQCKTTPSTLRDRMTRIPWDTLTKTFQDAVTFTHALGVNYLWIDGICIVQGDADDWNREAGKMFHVYKNAYVTLGALWGLHSNTGLLAPSDAFKAEFLTNMRLGEHRWPLFIQTAHPRFDDWDLQGINTFSVRNSPKTLLNRAWTYQERLISPRIIYFCEGELAFQCFRSAGCQCGVMNRNEISDMHVNSKTIFLKMIKSLGKQSAPVGWDGVMNLVSTIFSAKLRDQKNEWQTLVEEYSCLELSYGSDRLPAIAAVAQVFHQCYADQQYLAGVWSGAFLEGLLWMSVSSLTEEREINMASPLKRNLALVKNRVHLHYSQFQPETRMKVDRFIKFLTSGFHFMHKRDHGPKNELQLAPSWSWASSKGPLKFFGSGKKLELKAEVLRVECQYTPENPYGVPTSSTLVIRGRILECWCTRAGIWGGGWSVTRLTQQVSQFEYDDERETSHGKSVALLEMGIQNPEDSEISAHFFLILAPVNETGVLKRIGFLNVHSFSGAGTAGKAVSDAFDRSSSTRECILV